MEELIEIQTTFNEETVEEFIDKNDVIEEIEGGLEDANENEQTN